MPLVLVVDDQALVADVVAEMCREQGCDAVAVYDGEQALQFIQATPPSLVILDMNMPGVSGIDVLRAMQGLREGGVNAPPVVAYSASGYRRDEALRLGAVAFLPKVDTASLTELIERHCAEGESCPEEDPGHAETPVDPVSPRAHGDTPSP